MQTALMFVSGDPEVLWNGFRLGNLMLLSRRKNASLGNLDFADKRTRYFADRVESLPNSQRLLANESAHAFLYTPQWVTVANKNLRGLWKDMPIFVNDLSALSWT